MSTLKHPSTGQTARLAWHAVKANIYALALSALWTPLNSLLLPDRVRAVTSNAMAGSALGLVTFAGIGLAVVVQPIAGSVNDRLWWPRRRQIFIAGGTGSSVLLLGLLGWAPGLAWILVAYVLLQVSQNAAQAASQALIPDLFEESQRGLASGAKNALGILGSIIGLGGSGYLAGSSAGLPGALGFLALILVLCAALIWLWVPPIPPASVAHRARDPRSLVHPVGMARSFGRAFAAYPAFRLAVIMRFLFLLGIYPLQRFGLFFLQDRFQIAGLSTVSLALIGIVLVAALAAAAAGGVSDRVGRPPVLRTTILAGGIGTLGVALSPTLAPVAIAAAVVAGSFGAFEAVNWAQLSDAVPESRGAEFLGLANVATAGASALASAFGPLTDLAHAVLPVGTYALTFGLAALITFSALVPYRRHGVGGRSLGARLALALVLVAERRWRAAGAAAALRWARRGGAGWSDASSRRQKRRFDRRTPKAGGDRLQCRG